MSNKGWSCSKFLPVSSTHYNACCLTVFDRQVLPVASASHPTVKRRRSTLHVPLTTWFLWRMRGMAACSWVAVSRWTTGTLAVRRTSSRRPTGDVPVVDDVKCAFLTPSSLRTNHVLMIWNRTSKPLTSASEVISLVITLTFDNNNSNKRRKTFSKMGTLG